MFKIKYCFLLVLLICTSNALSAILDFDKNTQWASVRDIDSSTFSKKFEYYKNAGYLMIDIDAYKVNSKIRYSMIWKKNTKNLGWAEYRDMTSSEYNKRWKEFRDKGYRPIDIESYLVNGKQRFAGIWIENKNRLGWTSKRNLTAKQYSTYFKEQRKRNYRLIDMEAYETKSGTRYSAIWVDNKANIQWAQLRNMNRAEYQNNITNYEKKGFIVVDYESYKIGSNNYYAAIWEKRSGYASQVRTNRTEREFANLWREYRDRGFRLVDFERDGSKYSGVWIETASRYRYSQKTQIDKLIKDYLKKHDLPSVSVAIMQDESMIYRRGFGYADIAKKKVAHGETIYLAASVSKAIAGTLAVKLQEEGQLNNGYKVDLDLSKTTRSYLTNVRNSDEELVTLPSAHKHTVANILSHRACIKHYEGPEPTTKYYVKAIDALEQIWNIPFDSKNCKIGTKYWYSTHAFTYLAAVLEKVSNRTTAQLIRSEFAKPYKLNSMRALFANKKIPFDYDRATPYDSKNKKHTFSDNSWKILGGGIEISPVDLARFGSLILAGDILDETSRDDILWKKDSEGRGAGWALTTRHGRSIANHGGLANGARSILQVYRDNGLVIAIMSNRRGPSLQVLADRIGNTVLYDFSAVTRKKQNNDTQKWILTSLGNSTYTIQQKSNNRLLDAYQSLNNDFSVVTRKGQNSDTQKWILTPLGNSTYTIQQKSSNRFLDAYLSSNSDFSAVTRDEQKNNTQKWILTPLENSIYTIQQKSTKRFLDAHQQ